MDFLQQFIAFYHRNKGVVIGAGGGLLTALVLLIFWLWPRDASVDVTVQPFLVEVARVERGPITRLYNTNGLLTAVKLVQLYPEIDGRVEQTFIQQGMPVKQGQLLIQLSDRLMRAQLQEAEAKMNFAQSEYRRSKELYDQKFAAKSVLDDKQSRLEVARAEVAIAKARVDQTRIEAPFDGVIGLTKVSEGAMVNRNQELGTILMLDPLYVDFSVPESFLKDITLGGTVYVEVDGGLPMEASIHAIDTKAQAGTHSVQVLALLDNKDHTMRPGQFARVAVNLGQESDAVLVPNAAVERQGTRSYVFLVIDNTAIEKQVVLGTKEGDVVQVKEGLNGGETVVTVGQVNLHDGAFVKAADPDKQMNSGDKSDTQQAS